MDKMALRTLMVNQVRRYIETASKLYNWHFTMPRVRFDLTGKVGGWAKSSTWELNFNEGLMVDNVTDYLNNTVPHEVAHLVDGKLFRRDPEGLSAIRFTRSGRPRRAKRDIHGASWRKVMKDFGIENAERCHEMDVSATRRVVTKTRAEYKCHCGLAGGTLTVKMHRQIQSMGSRRYWKKCKHTILASHFVTIKDVTYGEKKS